MEESTLALSIPVGDRSPHLQQLTLVEHLKHWVLHLSVLLPMLSSFPSETFLIVEVRLPKLVSGPFCLLLLWCCWAAGIRRAPSHGAFWMCLIKLVALYFAVLPPPLETFASQTLQTAVELVGVASVKYLRPADSLARCMLQQCDTRAADEWRRMCCDGSGSVRGSVHFSSYFVKIRADIRS